MKRKLRDVWETNVTKYNKMANRGIEGEINVSKQAIRGAQYIKDFFEARPDRTFVFERIISQGSVSDFLASPPHFTRFI